MGPGQDARRELGGRSPIEGAVGPTGDLMERPQRQATARQPVVYVSHPKGKKPAGNPVSGFNPADLFPKDGHLGGGGGHGGFNCWDDGMFPFRSFRGLESMGAKVRLERSRP